MRSRHGRKREEPDFARQSYEAGVALVRQHPLFAELFASVCTMRQDDNRCPPDGWALVTANGFLHPHPSRRAAPEEWAYVIAHCLLHLGFQHFQRRERQREWNAACDAYLARFLAELKFGNPPLALTGSIELPARDEEALYELFCEHGIPAELQDLGMAGAEHNDMSFGSERWSPRSQDWQQIFARGLSNAVTSAVDLAAGHDSSLAAKSGRISPAHKAREWFINSYPLLGAVAAGLEIIENPIICVREQVSVAAVSPWMQELYINSSAGLEEQELRFVIAHELLHVGLQHHIRRQGRDPLLWNIACDFVINGWLMEMGVGVAPSIGMLHDPALNGESAESVYDRIVTDLRRYRKLATLRGVGACDILERQGVKRGSFQDHATLDEFYRRALSQGLQYHEQSGRGLLPAGLLEEIRALDQPPIPWDVELARWFDHYFAPVERARTYARLSRRQSATPDIPRPRWYTQPGAADARTYGVVLDTSGSMDRALLAKALGAIASYSIAREVPAVRVVFCDAAAYDQGYMPPEAIAGRVRVRGRGGTVLQPGIDLLDRAKDFPKDAPLLVITDGQCDRLQVRREHAFLLPEGRHLPFRPRGKVFRMSV
jgi:predicted metal-dependent peptidase